jgi:hypothetical protein
MENNLLRAVKYRIMDELRWSVQRNQVYRDKVTVYHKFPYKERPDMGVVIKNVSSSRIKLSPDDHAGVLKSHFTLAKAETHEGRFLDWVWEDYTNLTSKAINEDLSSQITGSSTQGTNRFFRVQNTPIISGYNNTKIADNFRQVTLTLNGDRILPEYVNGKEGIIALSVAPPLGSDLRITYYYDNLTPPGRYYVEIISPTEFVIDPFLIVRGEKVIPKTTGLETTANLDNGNLYGDFDELYTLKTNFSNKIYLIKGQDYTIETDGTITFLSPLIQDTTLYANYRYVGDEMGPFTVPEAYHYINNALPGASLAFSNEVTVGDKLVVIVYPQREPAANMKSGHYEMSFDIEVFTRDPIQLADLTDHILEDIWGNRRLLLMDEGITINEFDPTGESEEPYDENTGDLYYKNSLSLQLMTEWKKFIPFLTEILDFDNKVYKYLTIKDYVLTPDGKILELRIKPSNKEFEVAYPRVGYPKYI